MDQAIGQVMATLDEEGIAENTLVLFLSDNGGAAYASGGANNAPFRGGKGENFEGGIRVVAMLRWPARIQAGSKAKDIVSVMDVFPTLSGAAGIEPGNRRKLVGRNLWPALASGERFKRDKKLFFAAEMTVPGSLMTTVFDDEWKLVQRIKQTQLTVEITNSLFRISEDVVRWHSLHPVGETPRGIAPPPGWRAPRDWAFYPIPIADLLDEPAPGMAPPQMRPALDWQHGEQGRIIYDCEPYAILGGGLCK